MGGRKRRRPESGRGKRPDRADLSDQGRWALYTPWLEHDDPAVRANALICLIHQTNYLLEQAQSALLAHAP